MTSKQSKIIMFFYIKQSKLFSINGAPSIGGSGWPRSGPVLAIAFLKHI